MRYLVTGGAGFIGSHYVRQLCRGALASSEYAPSHVTVLDSLTYAGNTANLAPVAGDYEFVEADIRDREAIERAIAGHDFVVNFAAESHVDRSIHSPDIFVDVNVRGAQMVFEAARLHGVRRVVHIGTDEVYGSIESGSWTESSPLLPNSPYAASKASAELLVRAYSKTFGLDIVSTRCSNNYGPYQFPEKVIPLFVTNLIDGFQVPLYGDGRHRRDWLHVDDHVRGIQVALERGQAGESYNIGGGVELSNLDLTGRILEAMEAGWDMVCTVADRPGHDLRYSVDDSRIRQLGHRPMKEFSDGLEETLDWYRANEQWWRPLKAAV